MSINKDIKTFDASLVEWKGKEGWVDASKLGVPPGVSPYNALYDDGSDYGLKLINNEKGTECVFYLDHTVTLNAPYVNSGVVSHWLFKAVDAKGIKLCVYND